MLNASSSAFILEVHFNVSSNLLFQLEELLCKMVLCKKWCVFKFVYFLVKNKNWKYTVEECSAWKSFPQWVISYCTYRKDSKLYGVWIRSLYTDLLFSICSGMLYGIYEFLGNMLYQCSIIWISLLHFLTKSLFLKVVCKITQVLCFKIWSYALFWGQKKLLLLNTEKGWVVWEEYFPVFSL